MATGLATRCTACGTIFRVVPDQLRVSDGWVRCGRCTEVFNASAALIDLETGSTLIASDPPPPAPPAPPAASAVRAPAPAAAVPAPAPAPAPTMATTRPSAGPPAPPFAPLSPADPPRTSSAVPAVARRDAPPPPPAGGGGWNRRREPIEPSWGAPETAATAADEPSSDLPVVDDAASRFSDGAAPDLPIAAGPPMERPSFVQRAERARRWRSPRMRAALGALAVMSGCGLALQMLHEWRDTLAARQPALRPLLEAGCAAAGCRVEAARSIEGLTVESSGLVRVEKSSIYKLTVALRNRSGMELTLPALELSLNDAQGQLVARRVLNAPELGVNQTTLAAGRELALQATLQAAMPPVAGYTIELFYP